MNQQKIKDGVRSGWGKFWAGLKRGGRKVMIGIVKFLDPKFEKYRDEENVDSRGGHTRSEAALSLENNPKRPEIFTPESLADLFWILKKTPSSVLSDEERELIVAAMSFNERRVRDVMLPKSKMVMVDKDEMMGPLVLDKLYKSGLSHFPVKEKSGKIIGVLHTESLNNLEIKETDTAEKCMDPQVYYMRDDYMLEQAMAAFLRTNCYFFIVVNRRAEVVGMTSFEGVIKMLLGYIPTDTFTGDGSAQTVAVR